MNDGQPDSSLDETVAGTPDSSLIGYFDRIDRGTLAGWAMDTHEPGAPLKLGIWFEGVCVHSTIADTFRPDVAQAYGTEGFHGFEFACPMELRDVDVLSIDVIPVGARAPLRKSENVFRLHGSRLAQTGLPHPDQASDFGALWKSRRDTPPGVSPSQPEPKIGLVVANRNGATQLERLFASLEHYNTYKNFSLFVIDHGSTDSSFEICAQWAARLPIKFVEPANKRLDFRVQQLRRTACQRLRPVAVPEP